MSGQATTSAAPVGAAAAMNLTMSQIRTMVMHRVMADLGRHKAGEALTAFVRALDKYVEQHTDLRSTFASGGD